MMNIIDRLDRKKIRDHKETGENIPVKKGRVDSLTVYEVTDYELDQLEKGSPASLFLNFSILFLTTGVAFFIALLTTSTESIKVFIIFIVVTVISFIAGVVLFILWYRDRKSIKGLITKIKDRCP